MATTEDIKPAEEAIEETRVAVEEPEKHRHLSPEYSANIFSRIFFYWMRELFTVGNKRPLQQTDLFEVGYNDDVAKVADDFEQLLIHNLEVNEPKPVKRSLIQQFKTTMIWAGVIKFFNSTIQFAPPLLLNGLLAAIADKSSVNPSKPTWSGYVWAVGLFVAITLRVLIENAYFHKVMRVGFRVRSAVSAAVYRKSLRMSPVARQDTPVGKIVNLMQLDANRLESLTTQIHVLWDSPYQIIGYMVLLGIFLGWSALAGLGSMLLLIPLQMFFMVRMGRRRATIAKATDQRIKVTNEALQGVRTLKQYNWEDAYNTIIAKVRDSELAAIWRYNLIGTWNNTLMQVSPLVVGIVTLLVYSGTGGEFTAARIFSALSVLNSLRFPLMFFPSVIQQLADAKVSLGRLDKFLRQPEVAAYALKHAAPAASVPVQDDNPQTRDATEAKTEDVDVSNIPEKLRQPAVLPESLSADQLGIVVQDATFYHEEPHTRRARIAEAMEEKRKEAEIAARKKKQTPKSNGTGNGSNTPALPAAGIQAGTESNATDKPADPVPLAENAELPPVLDGVNLVVPKGQLYAVIGTVGTGKTSLCTGILGELYQAKGTVTVNGRMAYVAQSPWILNATVRKNITFAGEAVAAQALAQAGKHVDVLAPGADLVDRERYETVLDVCQLRHDVGTLSAGDRTEIGERGINLSGGQKQRVSIARAAYADAEVYVFDDPLSALDAEVGKAVFTECISIFLKGKTRLLVTNQLQFLPQCDGIIVLGQKGNGTGFIKYQGSFTDLIAQVPEFATLMSAYGHTHSSDESETGDESAADPAAGEAAQGQQLTAASPTPVASPKDGAAVSANPAAAGAGGLMTLEEKSEGAVPFRYYSRYFRAAGYVWLIFLTLFSAYLLGQFSQLVAQWWLSYWTSDTDYVRHPLGTYMGVYVAIGAGAAVFGFIRVITMAYMGIRASRSLHRELVLTILHAPQAFFDTTPLGRILARFSKDFDAIDNQLMGNLGMLGMCIFFVAGSMAAIIFATPWFALVVLLVVIIYYFVMNYFRNVARETKRYDALTRSPIFAHFSETLNGLSTIRGYGMVREFASQNSAKLAANVSAWYSLRSCDRWLSIRLESLGNLIILAAGLLAVGTAQSRADSNSAGLAGFSLSYAIAITGLLNWLVRTFAETEQTMNSVERVFYYKDNVPQEPYDPPANAPHLAPTWPETGSVVFKDYRMRYRLTTPEVLHGVSFGVRGGEKVGIVGRTGAGKSSIMQALFRMVEDRCHSGNIIIDGVDTDAIGLNQLRSKLAIIPQDPVMFSGTIRSNLDPIGSLAHLPDKGDGVMWDALTKVGLKEVIARLPGGLDAVVAEFGENLSAGQRQLLCLSRVLLRKTKIVLLDEASSALDHETDLSIQRAIREAFPNSTMLIIAHRLNTIISCDRVLVMDAGQVGEFAHPHELLCRPDSMFSSLVDETGPETSSALRALAAEAYNLRNHPTHQVSVSEDNMAAIAEAAGAGQDEAPPSLAPSSTISPVALRI